MADYSQQDNLELDDGALLERMLAGNEDAFVALYRRRQAALYRFAVRMTGSHAAAEDAVQETFLVLMRQGTKYESARGSVRAFLYGITRNCVLRAMERSRTLRAASEAEMESQLERFADCRGRSEFAAVPHGAASMEEALSRNQELAALRRAILALPGHYREVVLLCDLEELSYEEAAAALGCPVGTVRSRLHRARATLASKLTANAKAGQVGERQQVSASKPAAQKNRRPLECEV